MKFDQAYYDKIEASIPKEGFRTRFAPSPTGYMHLGNLRTALYGYLIAKNANGKFLLRIEDTDTDRTVDGAIDIIYNTLETCGITFDEGPKTGGPVAPYTQSERKEIYAAYAQLIMEKGHGYRCFCTKETLEEMKNVQKASRMATKYDGRCSRLSEEEVQAKLDAGESFVVRQKIPKEGKTSFTDMIFGTIEVENDTLDDAVLIKADGMPTYNFANVVDDHLMGITHVIRGTEYLASAPKYNLLYQGFGWEIPQYIHCSPVMKDATRKLSKREGDASFGDLQEKGYLTEAILNYIALLGWSPGGENEKFSIEELITAFHIEGISKSAAIFDIKKLNWLNGVYLRDMSDDAFHEAALPYIKKAVKRDIDTRFTAKMIQERVEILSDIEEQLDFIDTLPEYSSDLYENPKMKVSKDTVAPVLAEIKTLLQNTTTWEKDHMQAELKELVTRLGLKNGQVLYPLRVALSGKSQTPGGGVEIAVLLGKEETLNRLTKAGEML